jgi:3',5'-cyclic AMP phosphodiesterase CpdA
MAWPFRIIHLSDLHFGEALATPWWVRAVPVLTAPGCETHDSDVAEALAASILRQRRMQAIPTRVIATGDLTTWGTRDAFGLAFDYLIRSRSVSGPHDTVGLNEPASAVLPGNHDMWGGILMGMPIFGASSAAIRHRYFSEPSKEAWLLRSPEAFPYRVLLHAGPPEVCLYGLDSTRLDARDRPRGQVKMLAGDWGNVLADGYVDTEQLNSLEAEVRGEPKDPPRVRIVALHHPLAYPDEMVDPRYKVLLNRDEVVTRLQRLGFAIALCGHQHRGFVGTVSTAGMTDRRLHVLSVSTATQLIRKQASATVPPPNDDRPQRTVIGNEYRTYDFVPDALNPQQVVVVTVHSYEYYRRWHSFSRSEALTIPLDLSVYQPQ